jgi:hypothetical protein
MICSLKVEKMTEITFEESYEINLTILNLFALISELPFLKMETSELST